MADIVTVMADPLVDVTDLAKSFGRRPGVSGVSLTLWPGEIIGLVGANGGGKTTTLRMIAGLLQPGDGSGSVLGADVRRRRRASGSIGYMTQRLALYPELTVRENLRFRCSAQRVPDAASRIAALARQCGLDEVLDRRVAHLSGGWARRAQFAATIAHEPRLLLLDEPTAGLDAVTRRDLWQWQGELAAAGSAILVSTHDLHEAAYCHRILHYRDGIAEGPFTPGALIARSGAPDLEAAIIALAEGS